MPAGSPARPHVVDALVIGGGATGAGLLRDLSRRGLRTLLVEKSDFGTGTSGRYHGLLHSGGRYVVTDPVAARECITENRIVRRIAPACVEDTGGCFVATPEDPDDYADTFAGACAAAGVPADEIAVAALRAREPALSPELKRAFRVPDAVVEPWQLIDANLADARARGGDAWPYHRVVAMQRSGGRILGVDVADQRSGTVRRIAPRIVVSAAGAWAGIVAGLAGADLAMSPGKGTMLIFNQRMTDTVINRLKPPGDGDIMVPVHSVAILGTTEEEVDDPDVYGIRRAEVLALLAEGEKVFPGLSRLRLLRAYAGVRPLYREEPAAADGSAIDSMARRDRRRAGDLAGARGHRPRAPGRRRQPRLDRRRQAHDVPADGQADGRCGRPQARAWTRPVRPPTKSCPARATVGRTGSGTGWRSTRPPVAATPTSSASASS